MALAHGQQRDRTFLWDIVDIVRSSRQGSFIIGFVRVAYCSTHVLDYLLLCPNTHKRRLAVTVPTSWNHERVRSANAAASQERVRFWLKTLSSSRIRPLPVALTLDHVSPVTRLLEKRKQMRQVQDSLDAQKVWRDRPFPADVSTRTNMVAKRSSSSDVKRIYGKRISSFRKRSFCSIVSSRYFPVACCRGDFSHVRIVLSHCHGAAHRRVLRLTATLQVAIVLPLHRKTSTNEGELIIGLQRSRRRHRNM